MGTCISKCRPNPYPTKQSNLPQDKLVISQSPSIPSILQDFSERHPPSSSSSSSSSSSTTTSTSSSRATTTSSYSSRLSNAGSFANDFLWTRVRENPHTTILHHGKQSPSKPKPVKLAARSLGTPSKPVLERPKQPQPPKRARSGSPSFVRQKSFRSGPEQSSAVSTHCRSQSPPSRLTQNRPPKEARSISPSLNGQKFSRREFQQNSVAPSPIRNLSSPSPRRRFAGDAFRGHHQKCMRAEPPRHEFGLRYNSNPRPVSARKEKFWGLNPSGSSVHGSRLKRRETSVHPIFHPQVYRDEAMAVISDRDAGVIPPMEDMDNPLIALDCFIFI